MLRILGSFLFIWSLGCGQKTSSLSTTETPQPDQQYLTEADLSAQDLLAIAKPDVSTMIAAIRKSGVKVIVLRINSPHNTARTFDSDFNDPEYMTAVAYYSAAYEQGLISESSKGKRETFNGVYLRPSEKIALGGKRPFEDHYTILIVNNAYRFDLLHEYSHHLTQLSREMRAKESFLSKSWQSRAVVNKKGEKIIDDFKAAIAEKNTAAYVRSSARWINEVSPAVIEMFGDEVDACLFVDQLQQQLQLTSKELTMNRLYLKANLQELIKRLSLFYNQERIQHIISGASYLSKEEVAGVKDAVDYYSKTLTPKIKLIAERLNNAD